ncbi:hypothetical protein E3T25_10435 [Cryobacterium sandaracinum]|uniref:Secreted protein n=1 Tax=Cryobacterium sandaracinum TaxID=1259247 RepID=A0ABY2J9J8_9MICO|nr:hypothetical protein [Cryobacterium sandaracinum]TFD01634.1 hypothetical protein E3T25_10435 [Cryobacterium sandaracinum]
MRAGLERERAHRFAGFSRRRRLVIGSLIALAGVGVAVPAVATSILTRTGEFGDPSTSTEVDDTEWISLGADDAPQVVVDAYPDYLTLPATVPKEAAIAGVGAIFTRLDVESGGQGLAQEGLMTQTYESFAICAWTDDWLKAHKADDADRQKRAAEWLGDTDNFRTLVANDGGGVTDRLMEVAAGARDGDVDLMETSYTEQVCDQILGGGKR